MFEFLSMPRFVGGLMQWMVFIRTGQQAFVAEGELHHRYLVTKHLKAILYILKIYIYMR